MKNPTNSTFRLFYYLSLTAILSTGLFIIFISSLKTTVFDLSFASKYNISITTLQGWGFFTRNPREDQLALYQVKNGRKTLATFKNASFQNAFGFSRLSRRVNLEFQRLMGQVLGDTTNADIVHVKRDGKFIYLQNGEYIIEQRAIVPWLYAQYPNNYTPKITYKNIILYDEPISKND